MASKPPRRSLQSTGREGRRAPVRAIYLFNVIPWRPLALRANRRRWRCESPSVVALWGGSGVLLCCVAVDGWPRPPVIPLPHTVRYMEWSRLYTYSWPRCHSFIYYAKKNSGQTAVAPLPAAAVHLVCSAVQCGQRRPPQGNTDETIRRQTNR